MTSSDPVCASMDDPDETGFGLYVHWPFCLHKCPYCDFNSHVRRGGPALEEFGAALVRELEWFAARTPGRRLSSIFFGGGTPSLMPPQVTARVIDAATCHWTPASDLEITLEANPTSVEAGNFRAYRNAGVNRVSLGIQALDNDDLKRLGRQHTVGEALSAYRLAASIFPRTSFDLIYARPGQTLDAWRKELTRALGEQHGHMSLYQLTIEPGTMFHRLYAAGRLILPDDDQAAALYDMTAELTASAGLAAYEISNHAVPGNESRHNLVYWRYGEYAGIGPGAHARLVSADGRRFALETLKDPKTWYDRVVRDGHAVDSLETLSPAETGEEYVMMSLRLIEGMSLSRYRRLAGRDLDLSRIEPMCSDGILARPAADRICVTPAGRAVLNAVIAGLLA